MSTSYFRYPLFSLLFALSALFYGGTTNAQKLDGPLKIVVGFAPGGGSDRAARLLAEGLKDRLGVVVTVENKTGAGGRLSAQMVKATPADQNVLLLGNPANMVVGPLVNTNVGYDVARDFVPVSVVLQFDIAVSVGAAVPVREFNHLLAWLRANPEKANVGVPATGSLPHFFALMIGDAAGIKPQIVGYRGSAPLVTDLLGGQVPMSIDSLDVVLPLHETGKLRIVAIGAAKRLTEAPNIATLKESGLNLEAVGWNGLFAPVSMPAAKVQILARAIEETMRDPDMQAKFRAARITPVAASQAQSIRILKDFQALWEPVIKRSGFRE